MYIKVKHIKQFLLVSACIFFAGFNYLTYVNADNSRGNSVPVTCDKSIDSDCDGLTNSEEKLYGTTISNSDSDSDGYSDGVEVKSGYDPLKPAPDDKIITSTAASSQIQTGSSTPLTDSFTEELNELILSKKGQAISVNDIKTFADAEIAKNMGDAVTFDSLPEIDRSQIKILKQNYSSLSNADRKQKEKEDAAKYLGQVAYLLVNNAPNAITTKADFFAFQEEFLSNLSAISNTSVSLEYFSDLGNRLEVFLNQVNEVEVPETMVDLHVKFLRIAKGVLTLRDTQLDGNDPMGRLFLFSKASSYVKLFSDFFQNDFQTYFNNLK